MQPNAQPTALPAAAAIAAVFGEYDFVNDET